MYLYLPIYICKYLSIYLTINRLYISLSCVACGMMGILPFFLNKHLSIYLSIYLSHCILQNALNKIWLRRLPPSALQKSLGETLISWYKRFSPRLPGFNPHARGM
ncbi:hypothetical protein DPMN_148730 [Dreissena polymorpha]|uniref:Uncharacterized protein n=1 Tax=Dreissena polymorpha TaxID=45954 RepID=A0A9D4FG35_DREPO|nr:hypothetical protein DPMN_148730 [Dreissena polymorpha]